MPKIDPTDEIREHYKNLLTGLQVNGKVIPVVNLARVGQKPPYVLIFGGNSTNADTKGRYSDEVSINIQVHTDFAGDFGGEQFADLVVNEIVKKRFVTPGEYDSTAHFHIITCTRNINETVRIQTPTSVQILRQITFNHFVEQKK